MMYTYEIWLEQNCLRDGRNCEDYFDDSDEAYEEAKNIIQDIIAEWKKDNCYDNEVAEDFEIRIVEDER